MGGCVPALRRPLAVVAAAASPSLLAYSIATPHGSPADFGDAKDFANHARAAYIQVENRSSRGHEASSQNREVVHQVIAAIDKHNAATKMRGIALEKLRRFLAPGSSVGSSFLALKRRRPAVQQARTEDRRPLQEAQRPMFFMHIPKTAGTFIEDSALASGVRWGRNAWNGSRQLMPDGNMCSHHHVPPTMLQEAKSRAMYGQGGVFCIVRHPYERLVSEYSYRLAVKGIPPHYLKRTECTSEGLNFFVQEALATYASGKRYAFDCHLLPQHEFIYGGGRWCEHILKMDDLPGAFNDLMEQKGLDVRIQDQKHFTFSGKCPNLSARNLSRTTRLMLDAVYAADMRTLDFKPIDTPAEKRSGACNVVTDSSGASMVCPPGHVAEPSRAGICVGTSDGRRYVLPSGRLWPNSEWGVPAAGPPTTTGRTVVFVGGQWKTNGVPLQGSACAMPSRLDSEGDQERARTFLGAARDEKGAADEASNTSLALAAGLDKAAGLERELGNLEAELEAATKDNVELAFKLAQLGN